MAQPSLTAREDYQKLKSKAKNFYGKLQATRNEVEQLQQEFEQLTEERHEKMVQRELEEIEHQELIEFEEKYESVKAQLEESLERLEVQEEAKSRFDKAHEERLQPMIRQEQRKATAAYLDRMDSVLDDAETLLKDIAGLDEFVSALDHKSIQPPTFHVPGKGLMVQIGPRQELLSRWTEKTREKLATMRANL